MSGRFVVAGTGRSGTGFLSRALTELGLPTGHEAVFDFDLESSGTLERWAHPRPYAGHEDYDEELVGDASLGVVFSLGRLEGTVSTLVHVTRNPADVLRSWLGSPFFAIRCTCHPNEADVHLRTPYAKAMLRAFPIGEEGTELGRAVRWMTESSRALELYGEVAEDFGVSYLRLRLEDLGAYRLAGLAAHLGATADLDELAGRAGDLLQRVGHDVNRHPRADLANFEATPALGQAAKALLELGHRQGYTTEEMTAP